MTAFTSTSPTVAELRRAFDRTFAEAPDAGPAAAEDFLDIRLGGAKCALRLADLAELMVDVPITPLPSAVPDLAGIAGLRHALLPVYDLRGLLGHPGDQAPRWLAIAAARPVGLAFDAVERHVRIPKAAVVARGPGAAALRHVHEIVDLGGVLRPIVSVASVLDEIAARARRASREE